MSVPEYKSAASIAVSLVPRSTPLRNVCDKTVTLIAHPVACSHIYGYPTYICLAVYDRSPISALTVLSAHPSLRRK